MYILIVEEVIFYNERKLNKTSPCWEIDSVRLLYQRTCCITKEGISYGNTIKRKITKSKRNYPSDNFIQLSIHLNEKLLIYVPAIWLIFYNDCINLLKKPVKLFINIKSFSFMNCEWFQLCISFHTYDVAKEHDMECFEFVFWTAWKRLHCCISFHN